MSERYVIKDRWIFDTKLNKNIHSIDCYEEKSILDIMNSQDQRIAELEEQLKNSIRPKFKVGQEVWVNKKHFSSDVLHPVKQKIVGIEYHYNIENYPYHDATEDELFATKEEAQTKLEKLGEKK